MANYIVRRHGSNAANQSMTQIAVVGSVEAKNRKEAREKFTEENPTVAVYNNQFLEFVPLSKATQEDQEAANECDVLNEVDGVYFDSLGRAYGRKVKA